MGGGNLYIIFRPFNDLYRYPHLFHEKGIIGSSFPAFPDCSLMGHEDILIPKGLRGLDQPNLLTIIGLYDATILVYPLDRFFGRHSSNNCTMFMRSSHDPFDKLRSD